VRDDGEVRAEFTATTRAVTLLRGEAYFTVAKDATRPFIVTVGFATVRAVGTAFNVRLDAARVEVLVTQGKVEVEDTRQVGSVAEETSALVVEGQKAVVDRAAVAGAARMPAGVEITRAAPAEMEHALEWQSTRLVFDRTRLDDAVAAFNRYSSATAGLRLVLGDAALSTRRMGGTFRAANVEGFVRLLEQSGEFRAERQAGRIVLWPAH
jgi:transmembrane sensor